MSRDGKLFGYPYTYNGRGLVYFPDTLRSAGVDEPSVKWTPEDFLQAAKALTGEGTFGYSSMGNYLYDINFWIGQFGGTLTTGEGTAMRVTFASPEAITAIRWFLALATEHRVMPMPVIYYRVDSNPTNNDPSYELQAQGKLGMWFDSSLGGFDPMNMQNDPSAPKMTPAAMGPLPIGAEGVKSADLTTTGFYVSANAQNPQACMQVIAYLSDKSALFNNGGIPARNSLANSPVFEQSNGYLVPLRDALQPTLTEKASNTGSAYNFYQFEAYWLNEAIDMILTQKADAAMVLKKAQETTNVYLTCVEKMDPKTGSLLACATGADAKPMGEVLAAAKAKGLWPFTHFNRIHVTPPLTTSDAEIAEGLAIIDEVLDIADTYYTGK
jgi:ABC-type glycerol-3-phosphate transport system substrate-binding protein